MKFYHLANYDFSLIQAYNKFGWSIPSIPSPIVMTPSSGASKAEFYDALQRLQAKEDINLVSVNTNKTLANTDLLIAK